MSLLKIENLNVSVNKKQILENFCLAINENETHVIMGPNGCGKSTLSKVLAGHPFYEIEGGNIKFNNENLISLNPEQRSLQGLFLAFQYPLEISGVSNQDFLREIYNNQLEKKGLLPLDPIEFFNYIKPKLNLINMDLEFLQRNLNEGFSGGEKKRNEILQMILLQPKLIILDEIDSGLDVDSMFLLAKVIKEHLPKDSSLLIITHYYRFVDYLKPNFVHIMQKGKILKTGDDTLAKNIEERGFSWIQ